MVYKYRFHPQVYELLPDGRVRAFANEQELRAAGYTFNDVQTREGELYKKPNDPTVYEYHPETQQSYPMSGEQYRRAGYDPNFRAVQTWDDATLEDNITADIAVEDYANSDTSFDDWYSRFAAADLASANQLAKEYMARDEARFKEDIGQYLDQLNQDFARFGEDYQTNRAQIVEDRKRQLEQLGDDKASFLTDVQTAETQTLEDKVRQLDLLEKQEGLTLRAKYDQLGARNLSRSGIRQREEGEIVSAFDQQEQNVNTATERRMLELANRREQGMIDFTRRQQGVQTAAQRALGQLDLGKKRAEQDFTKRQSAYGQRKTRGLEDISRAREEFRQNQLDQLKENRRPAYESYLRRQRQLA